MRYDGKDAIGHRRIDARRRRHHRSSARHWTTTVAHLRTTLPVGLELDHVADQPHAVARSVGEFIDTLAEAVAIVLLVSFFSLGLRTGLVVALSIPLVLAMTFAAMKFFGIGLHKISLGALVLALGLLVDDAIIAVEMMAIKMEQGLDRVKAAAFAYTSTAFPMLTGTLVTAAGFLPIATAQVRHRRIHALDLRGRHDRAADLLDRGGDPDSAIWATSCCPIRAPPPIDAARWRDCGCAHASPARARPDRADCRETSCAPPSSQATGATPLRHDPYATPFYRRFRALVDWCVEHR